MLLFQKRFHEGLLNGTVRVTFRAWDKPHVREGGRYRCHPIGVLEVDRIDRVTVSEISREDARLSGFATRAELIAYLNSGPKGPLSPTQQLYRVELHHGGDGDRVELALEDELTSADVQAIRTKLKKLDAKGPWTQSTLALIRAHPRVVASKLAALLGRETAPFKEDVRKLKRMGLTQSFEKGYELSPRGEAYWAAAAASEDSA